MKISKGTWARTAFLGIVILVIILEQFGITPEFLNDTVSRALQTAASISAMLLCWWKNNSFTPEALAADDILKQLKEDEK